MCCDELIHWLRSINYEHWNLERLMFKNIAYGLEMAKVMRMIQDVEGYHMLLHLIELVVLCWFMLKGGKWDMRLSLFYWRYLKMVGCYEILSIFRIVHSLNWFYCILNWVGKVITLRNEYLKWESWKCCGVNTLVSPVRRCSWIW